MHVMERVKKLRKVFKSFSSVQLIIFFCTITSFIYDHLPFKNFSLCFVCAKIPATHAPASAASGKMQNP